MKSIELTERFLWDVRLTAQELVLEEYAGHLKPWAQYGFELSGEPYDTIHRGFGLSAVAMCPCAILGAGYG